MKKLSVAINGFGRIGRNVLRAYLEYHDDYRDIEIVAINDVSDAKTLLHLFQFDSAQGRLSLANISAEVVSDNGMDMLVARRGEQVLRIRLLQANTPEALIWGELDIDVVLECTGKFRSYKDASRHRQAGARQVIVGAAPFDEVDASIVIGVNDDELNRNLAVISGVSCTTQALVPPLSVLDKAFGVESVMLTEIHAVTADQMVLDGVHRDFRRARASGFNIIPTTSSSIAATERVLPNLIGKINGHSIRVPTQTVAAIDVSLVLYGEPSIDEVLGILKLKAQQKMTQVMGFCDEPLVSSDFIHDRHSLVIDTLQTMRVGSQFKLFAWYDNEWGYANRLLDMCKKLAKS